MNDLGAAQPHVHRAERLPRPGVQPHRHPRAVEAAALQVDGEFIAAALGEGGGAQSEATADEGEKSERTEHRTTVTQA